MGKIFLSETKARRSATDFLSSLLSGVVVGWRGARRTWKKSVTDTDSGMQQEHSRKSMFSSSAQMGREGHEGRSGGREGELRQPAKTFLFDFRLASSHSLTPPAVARFGPEITARNAAAAKSR